jgi:hypothetical protein
MTEEYQLRTDGAEVDFLSVPAELRAELESALRDQYAMYKTFQAEADEAKTSWTGTAAKVLTLCGASAILLPDTLGKSIRAQSKRTFSETRFKEELLKAGVSAQTIERCSTAASGLSKPFVQFYPVKGK